MKTKAIAKSKKGELLEIPDKMSDIAILQKLRTMKVSWADLVNIKTLTNLSDEIISTWLDVSVKTFRAYKRSEGELDVNIKERVIMLQSLINHGIQVFGNKDDFNRWLNQPNFIFDYEKPISYLNTITGIRIVDDRLTAIEFGDNV
jgi:putative toxin-antitoxin system antitoxin component (TIGR02293 family)